LTLIWATASTVTATPCSVYRSCSGDTSKDISSRDSSWLLCTIGQMIEPPPVTMRVPPKPYTIRAWLGPTLRNMRARIHRMIISVRTARLAVTRTPPIPPTTSTSSYNVLNSWDR